MSYIKINKLFFTLNINILYFFRSILIIIIIIIAWKHFSPFLKNYENFRVMSSDMYFAYFNNTKCKTIMLHVAMFYLWYAFDVIQIINVSSKLVIYFESYQDYFPFFLSWNFENFDLMLSTNACEMRLYGGPLMVSYLFWNSICLLRSLRTLSTLRLRKTLR